MSKKRNPTQTAFEAVAQEIMAEDAKRLHQLDLVDALRRTEGGTQLARLKMATDGLLRADGAARHARIVVQENTNRRREREDVQQKAARVAYIRTVILPDLELQGIPVPSAKATRRASKLLRAEGYEYAKRSKTLRDEILLALNEN